ncbi:MAG: type II toxin-antitoxin system VapC family toxin [Candidatus Hydrogenedentes bacterium]|nr:type II toxin-antitoxin system VapC family toxin [Candidatus Hydrogenedentota bacterium]
MITAVDTNVLIDLFRDTPDFGRLAAEAVRRCMQEGRLVVCDIVWAELAGVFPSVRTLEDTMERLQVDLLAMEPAAAALAGETWRRYRAQGGGRERMVADFLIAAHAMAQCDRLLSRDRGFFRNYFPRLSVIDPSG